MVWEGYKSIIECSKGNKLLEEFYFESIKKALEFAYKYKRINELKRFVIE